MTGGMVTMKRSTMKRRGKRWGPRPRVRPAIVAATLLAGCLALAACSSSSSPAASSAKSPVIIGASVSLSGDFAADGQNYVHAYDLWAAQQNAKGGLLGHPIQLKLLSDGSDPSQVVTNYNTLVSLDHAKLLLGPFSTLLTVPAEKVAARYGYALVFGSGGGEASFAHSYDNIFDVSPPVLTQLLPLINWIKSLPPSQRPTTAAYPTSDNPFTEPSVLYAEKLLTAAGIKDVYSKVFPAEVTDYTPIADAVVQSKAQLVIVGSTAVPDSSAFVTDFASQHYNPKILIETSGPDQTTAFSKVVGVNNTSGILFPNGWYPGFKDPMSEAMVQAYVKRYGGTASDVSADVAEAYSAGQVLADAVEATHSFDNAKIIAYLHSGVTLQTVQGPVRFNKLGENPLLPFVTFQWQHGTIVQVLPAGEPGSVKIEFPKPAWGS
jgi:branched-chain amino acid transport system substrate-binding protein